MSYLVLRNDFNNDGEVTCPICKNNQLTFLTHCFEKNKIIINFCCIDCNEKIYNLNIDNNTDKLVSHIYWTCEEDKFFKIIFD